MNPANRRIALNTVYMYVRFVTLMAVGLYTSRLVLSVLGVSDYGIFAVVGGVMALFTFLSNALANATSRFLNTEIGRGGGRDERHEVVHVEARFGQGPLHVGGGLGGDGPGGLVPVIVQ